MNQVVLLEPCPKLPARVREQGPGTTATTSPQPRVSAATAPTATALEGGGGFVSKLAGLSRSQSSMAEMHQESCVLRDLWGF